MLPTEPRLLVFDLDGTLVDSRTDLTNAVNATLATFGHAPLPEPVIAGYIGDGVTELVRRSLAHAHLVASQPAPHDQSTIASAVDFFLRFYREHKLDFTYVYPGVLQSLTELRRRRPTIPMAVLTNKPVNPSRGICDGLGLTPFFFQNYGGNSFATKKPDPTGLRQLIAEAANLTGSAIKPDQVVVIGDSHVDVETARNAGAASLGCRYGLSPDSLAAAHPDASVGSAEEWPDLLLPNA